MLLFVVSSSVGYYCSVVDDSLQLLSCCTWKERVVGALFFFVVEGTKRACRVKEKEFTRKREGEGEGEGSKERNRS